MSPWLFSVYTDSVMKGVKMGMGRWVVRFMEDGRECRLSGLFYEDDLFLFAQLEKNLRTMGDSLLRCVGGQD